MTSRFLIPGTVAACLHAMVFFGLPHSPCAPRRPVDLIPAVVLTALEYDDVPVPSEQSETSETIPIGVPDARRSEEPLAPPQDSAFQLPPLPITPLPRNASLNVILTGKIGTPEGTSLHSTSTLISASHLDFSPRTRAQVRPAYPFDAKKDALNGEVLVTFTVDENGQVVNPRVIRSSNAVFEEPTLRAVAKWRFEPGRKNGRVVRFQMALPVQFSMNDE